MSPATGAFLVRRASDGCTRFFGRLQFQVAQDEKFLEFLSRKGGREALVAVQDKRRFERVTNEFFLACLFDCLADDSAEFEQLLHFSPNDRVSQVALRLRKQLEVDRVISGTLDCIPFSFSSLGMTVAPRFLGGENEDRREEPAERVEDLVHRHLRGAATR